MQPAPRYTTTAVGLHWIVFLLVVCGWVLGQYVGSLTFSPQKRRYISWHKWIGVTVFLFALVRVAWRGLRPAPPLPDSISVLQRHAAVAMHALLYALLLVIPVSGWLYSSAAGVPTVWLGVVQLPDLLQKDKALSKRRSKSFRHRSASTR